MRKCEICEKERFSVIATEIREGAGRILSCDSCGLVIQDLDWDGGRLRDYYEKEYQATNSLVTGREQSPEEHFQDRLKTLDGLFRQVRPLLGPEKKVLEVGAGPGALLSLCRPFVRKCVGVELNSAFAGHMRDRLGIEAYSEDVNLLPLTEKFDLIIIIATLDHLPNPLETLLTLKRLLLPGGKIYLEVPGIDQALFHFLPEPNLSRFRKFFWHRAHLFYFGRESIAALFRKAGLEMSLACRHDYTLRNFLQWYFRGEPQSGLVTGMAGHGLFSGESDFEKKMNHLMEKADGEFRRIMAETFMGESLCCTGWIK